VRVLCWVLTKPENLQTKAVHVKNTWARRCDKVVFVSSKNDTEFPTVGINVTEDRNHLTEKTMRAFKYIYDHHFNDADWFLKTDDDTYVIVENLRYFLSSQNKDKPIYFGHHFNYKMTLDYASGGAGYVLSKEALRRFGKDGTNASICRQQGGAEDVDIGICLKKLGIIIGNSTDRFGRSRFHSLCPTEHVFGDFPDWYYKYDMNGAKRVSIFKVQLHFYTSLTFRFHHQHLFFINVFLRISDIKIVG